MRISRGQTDAAACIRNDCWPLQHTADKLEARCSGSRSPSAFTLTLGQGSPALLLSRLPIEQFRMCPNRSPVCRDRALATGTLWLSGKRSATLLSRIGKWSSAAAVFEAGEVQTISQTGQICLLLAPLSRAGQSLRAAQRRLRRWAGQNKQSLAFYARVENLQRLAIQNGPGQLAAIAHDAGFSDQSHMGRALRRATGFPPALLNRLIATDESFWYCRLMGERF